MGKKIIISALVVFSIIISLFAACSSTSTESTTSTYSSTTTSSSTVSTTSATSQDWWISKWDTPKYGGQITEALSEIPGNFDPYNGMFGQGQYYEPLWYVDPTLDRTKVNLTGDWTPYTNWKGNLLESWDWEDPQTMVVHLRQNVYWQDKAPVNGRQFTAADVVFHFDRMFGTGNGFTTPNPFFNSRTGSLQQVSARDNFTAIFKFGTPSVFINSESIIDQIALQSIEAPEVYAMGSPIAISGGGPPGGASTGPSGYNSALNDWQNAVGTSPFILTEVVSGTSMTYSKNPNYWGYDERYPQNKLPYIDTLKVLAIPDQSTSLAALRTGKIDFVQNITWQNAASLQKTNPDLLSGPLIQAGQALLLRSDIKPFSDINVRKAIQLALDLPTIASGYYGGSVDPTPVGLVDPNVSEGFAIPYTQWSQELKDEYSYNPSKAKQLLADAGYPSGFTVDCDAFSDGMSDLQLAQVFKSYLQEINVTINIQTYDAPTLLNIMGARKQSPMTEWLTGSTMPPLSGLQMYLSTELTNPISQTDTTFDQMVKACNSANTIEEAQQKVSEADQYFLRQHWIALTFVNNYYTFWQPYLKGYAGEKRTTSSWCTSHWWIDQEK